MFFEICAVSAVINFNDAMVGLFRVLAKFDIITDSNYASTKWHIWLRVILQINSDIRVVMIICCCQIKLWF